jgi:hypothetical protein
MNASKFYIPELNRLSIVNKSIFANISVIEDHLVA